MTIQHVDLPESALHETKGASTAVAGTSPVSDGAGSAAWSIPKIEGQGAATAGTVPVSDGIGGVTWKQAAGSLFGDMDFNNNVVATTISVASPLAGDGNAVLLSGATLTTPAPLYAQGVADTITFENTANNELLRVPVSGVYEVSFGASFSGGGGGAGNVYRFNFATNGVEQTSHAYARRQTSSGDIGNVHMSEYVQLSANDTIQPVVGNESGTNNPTISSSSFTVVLLKES